MRNKIKKIKAIIISISLLMIYNCVFAGITNNDGSAFITKAEFDALKSLFQSEIDKYNTAIDSKIDQAIASYLSGISIEKDRKIDLIVPFKDVEWIGAFPSTVVNNNPFQYQVFYRTYVGFGTTYGSGNGSNWNQLHFQMWEWSSSYFTKTPIPPVNYGGYYINTDDRTGTTPYLNEIRKLEPMAGNNAAGSYPTWRVANVTIATTGIRGANCLFYTVKDRAPSYTITVNKGEATVVEKYYAKYADNSNTTPGSDNGYSATVTDRVMNYYTNSLYKDCRKTMFCCLSASDTKTLPLYDIENDFNWKIETASDVNIFLWNAFYMYNKDIPSNADRASQYEEYSINMPYYKLNDTDSTSNRDVYSKLYSSYLLENGYPQYKVYAGIPLVSTNFDGGKVTFKIKNTGTSANSFAIKDGPWENISDKNGVNIKVNGVEYANRSSSIASGATVDIEFASKNGAKWWFKSIGAGSWEIVDEIHEKSEA